MKIATLLTLSLLIAACAGGGYNPRYYYDQIQVSNLTGETMTNLKVQIGPGGRVLECAEVTDNRICQQRFGRRPYPEQTVDLTWTNSDGQPVSRQTNPSIPAYFSAPGVALMLFIEIKADGSLKVYFEEDNYMYN